MRDDVNCSPDLRSLIQSMLEVDPRKRPSIEEILMRPCCLTRLHTLYPQYIPTLFPYTTPSFHPFTPSVSSHYSKRPISPSGHTSTPSVQSSSNPDSSKRDSSHQNDPLIVPDVHSSPQGIVHSSPSIVLQRVKDDDGLSTEDSSISNPRRISLPSRLEVRPIVRRVSVGEPISLHRINSRSVTNDHNSKQHEVIVKPHKVRVAAIHDTPSETEAVPVIRPLRLSPVGNGPSSSVHSSNDNQPTQSSPTQDDHSLVDNMEPRNPRRIIAVPVKHGRKNEIGWRVPSEEEERRHKEGLQELRERYLAIRKQH